MTPAARRSVGIVVPTLEEAATLPHLLDDLRRLPFPNEIVVSDGGSIDGTPEIAEREGFRTIRGAPGRARQMNAGARALRTRWLLFLHADSRLPEPTRRALGCWLDSPHPCEAAHFAFSLDARGFWWTLIERGQQLRERVTGLTYGDQGLLVSRVRYEEIGGIPELPLMEDVEAVHRLRRTGGIDRIEAPIVTSARRYRDEGPVLSWLRNACLISLYSVGVPARLLSRWYRPRSASGSPVARPS